MGGDYAYVSTPRDIHGKVMFWARFDGEGSSSRTERAREPGGNTTRSTR